MSGRALITVLCLTFLLPACSKREPAKDASVFRIGFSQCNLGEPWRVQMNKDIETAARAHPEIDLVMKDAQNDAMRQVAQIREFIAAGVDLLIVSPKEAAPLTPPVKEAFDKGIPVIVLDRRVLGDAYTAFIGADNKRIGRAAGRWIKEKLGGKGKVVELKGLMTSTPGQDRNQGFRDGIAGGALEIVFEADMKWLEGDARQEMESALARNAAIDCVYAHNDPGAHGAYLAAKAAGREKSMIFVGIDALPHEGRAYVQQGLLAASFEYPTGGARAVAAALDLRAKRSVPKEIILASRIFTKENVDRGGDELAE